MRVRHTMVAGLALAGLLGGATGAQARTPAKPVQLQEYRLSASAMETLRERWLSRLAAKRPDGGWVPLRMNLTNRDLALMGLPSKRVLLSRSYSKPTQVKAKGKPNRDGGSTASSGITTFAGTGYFGIRPGAWVLLMDGGGIGWCSLAHVYGSPGSYKISTAGHCGNVGDVVTAIGVDPASGNPVLLDFGKFSKSTDNGLGNDWGLIDVYSKYQHLVTPTMAFWGGPRGMFTKTGDVARISDGNKIQPGINPDPFLAQQIVHYGHGTGVGAGGTPRSGTAIAWRSAHFMFFGAISPGDSGSGANTLTGDTVGANMEAAGIMTHLYVDPLMRAGLGLMGGTRSTKVSSSPPTSGQLVGYPVPAPILP